MEKDDVKDDYQPDPGELLEAEINHEAVEEDNSPTLGRVEMPEPEVETGDSTDFKEAVAQQIGNFGDKVLIDSPATETEEKTSGPEGLKDIIEEFEDKLAEKMNNKE